MCLNYSFQNFLKKVCMLRPTLFVLSFPPLEKVLDLKVTQSDEEVESEKDANILIK